MKKLLLVLSLFVCTISFGQPKPPMDIDYDNPYNQLPKESKFTLVVNLGILQSLGGEVTIKLNKSIIGIGYAGNVNQYKDEQYKNETLYLSYGYKPNKFIYGGRIGKQNEAKWVPTQNNPNTQEKQTTSYTVMVGGFIGYQVNNRLRIILGFDSFSQATIGFGLRL
jgi:hypothetical protein